MNVFDVPSDPAFWQDPFPFYQAALSQSDGLLAMSSGGYAVLGYDALFELGRDPRVEGFPFPAEGLGADSDNIFRLLQWGLFAMSAPLHRPLRQAVIAGLSAVRIGNLQEFALAMAREQRAVLAAATTPDLLEHFTKPLAARVYCRFVGLDEAEVPGIVEAIDRIGDQFNGRAPEGADLANRSARALLAQLERCEAEGTSDLIRDIAAKLPADSPASASELVGSFVFDNVEMLSTGLFNVLELLMRREAFSDELADGTFTRKAAVQEAYRLATPATLTSRIAHEDIDWNGHHIVAGSPLMMWWAAGNLDETAFPEPLLFDPNRANNRHLSFGVGAHACLGRHISSVVTEAAVGALLVEARVRPLGDTVFLPQLTRIVERFAVHLD
ncbi:cytochrome P450 [Devosia sp. 2618]|uniref:cytochrome P450 n=1 Tax=Devosia sp. 2618 TaxID=3156454 RepID=UPI0033953F90